MARSLNIPARFAIGFLKPEQIGPNTYVYSAHDLHAWPELYFPGAGWVRFEPTPPDRAATTPGYTQHEFPEVDESDLPSSGATTDDITRPEISDPKDQNPQDLADEAGGFPVPWRVIGAGALALAVLVGLALVPRLVRRRRRERRLGEGPEPVWIELRDTVVDLGLTWPPGRSPRETGAHLVHYFGRPPGTDTESRPRHGADVSPEAERALQRIVATIEQQRYARPGSEQAAILKADAETVIASLQGGVPAGDAPACRVAAAFAVREPATPTARRLRVRRGDDLHRRRRPRGLMSAVRAELRDPGSSQVDASARGGLARGS